MYAISDMFYSIQGEGAAVGRPMVFLRFAECNLHCSFCDTDFSVRQVFEEPALIRKALEMLVPENTIVRDVCLTGGEPFLQIDAALIAELMESFPKVHIESNGTLPWPDGIVGTLAGLGLGKGVAYLTVSPKRGTLWCKTLKPSAVKVIDEGQDLSTYTHFYGDLPAYYLQPITTDDENTNAVNRLNTAIRVMRNPRWRLSLQTHKWIGVV